MHIDRPQKVLISVAMVLALGAGLTSVALAQTPAPYVKVFVDGSPVYFDQAPVIANGRVLVPLRGVFERLGAFVAWDPASQTVLAQPGATNVSLTIGSTQAFVDGQAQSMDVPAMLIGGRTMVPLRFISQALGAEVGWDAVRSTVQISSRVAAAAPPSVPPSATYPPVQAQAPVSAPQAITGAVIEVSAVAYPGQLTVQAPNGTIYTYHIVSGTTITSQDSTTGASHPVSLNAIRPGEMVSVVADQNGTAQSVHASFRSINGTIASTGNNWVVLQDGQTYTLGPTVQVVRGGEPVTVGALGQGDVVTLRVNPESGQVYGIAVRHEASANTITSVTVTPKNRQLSAGDVVTVVAKGPSYGTATFTITGLRTALPMAELAAQPGTYIGTYAVQPGDYVASGGVVVSLTAPNGRLLTARAPIPISINAATVPAALGEAPVITSPTPGSDISSPFTVTGIAPPGSQVRVTAGYTMRILLVSVQGTLGSQTVAADANGYWSATFDQAPPERGVGVTISAVVVDYTGAARSPSMSVNTTLN